MRRLLGLAALLLLLVACGGEARDTVSGPAAERNEKKSGGMHEAHGKKTTAATACKLSGASLKQSAESSLFEKDCLAAPAGEAFTIEFNNKDSVQHSIAIRKTHETPEALFQGEVFAGPKIQTYQVQALDKGSYHFHCDVHPEAMQGDFEVQ